MALKKGGHSRSLLSIIYNDGWYECDRYLEVKQDWKKLRHKKIKEYADIISLDLIDAAMREAISTDSLATSIAINSNTICMSRDIEKGGTLISSLSEDVYPGSIHTKEYMTN